jgi:hypothetical protein
MFLATAQMFLYTGIVRRVALSRGLKGAIAPERTVAKSVGYADGTWGPLRQTRDRDTPLDTPQAYADTERHAHCAGLNP